MFELLLKIRRTGAELEIATIGRSVSYGIVDVVDRPGLAVATAVAPPANPVEEPGLPVEANPITNPMALSERFRREVETLLPP